MYIGYIKLFINYIVSEKHLSNNTAISYRTDLTGFFNEIKNTDVRHVTRYDIITYINALDQRNYATITIFRKVSVLRSFFKFLYLEKYTDHNIASDIDLPKISVKIPDFLTVEEINTLFKTLDNIKSHENIRLRAILEMLYSSGMRISELLNIKLDDVLYNNASVKESIVVSGKGKKERTVFLNDHAIKSLNIYIKDRRRLLIDGKESKWLFCSYRNNKNALDVALTRQRVFQLLKQLAINSGIDATKVTPHVFRHSFATHLLANNVDIRFVQEFLGHTNIATTQIYTKISNNQLKETINNKHPLSKNGDITLD